jgi:multiple sugar transport system substrate-binding protein
VLFLKKVILAVLVCVFVISGFASRIIVNSYMSDPAPRQTFTELVKMFEEQNPGYEVVVNTFAHEDFKTLLRTWLGSRNAPDVVTWFAGERMRYFASRDLLAPIDEIFTNGFGNEFPEAFKSASYYQDKAYFVPQSWYWWGMYYNTEVFEELGLKVPVTWDEFIDVCETLKVNGYIPITIGTRYLWTTGGWFDYLNMRVNGLEFHEEFTAGKVAWTDPRIRKVFEYWGQLVNNGYFLENHSSYDWQTAANDLFSGRAGMYLMGQFIKDVAPDNVKDKLDFFRFPVIDPNIGLYEDTPIDGFMVPANARNKEGAMKFMEFIASQNAQQYFAEELGRLAAHRNVPAVDDHAQDGLNMILESDGVMQFYDRDTDPQMADRGMNAFVEFMMFPDRLDRILQTLERERQRIFR